MSEFSLLFGKIAVDNGFLTQEQLDECAEIQRTSSKPRHLGEICKEKGYLHVEDLRDILIEQLLRFHSEDEHSDEKLVDRIFGQVAIAKEFLTESQLNHALQEQASRESAGKPYQRIGEVLADMNALTTQQVAEILEAQDLTILICKTCVSAHNVPNYAADRRYICKVCNDSLVKPDNMSEYAIRQALS